MKKSIQALKRYGQNFLVDENIINKIISSVEPKPNDNIIEIGPGQGAITKYLFNSCENFCAIEIDIRAIEKLKSNIPEIKIIEADALKVNFNDFYNEQELRVIGNIPYNITSDLIGKLLQHRSIIKDAFFMMQYEAAKRLTAIPGEKDYNALTILVRCFCNYKILFNVSRNSFLPKPNVNSAFVKFEFNKNIDPDIDDKILTKLVKTLFVSRRKTLNNSLQNSIFRDVDFSKLNIDLSLRPEKLDVSDFMEMTKFIQAEVYDK